MHLMIVMMRNIGHFIRRMEVDFTSGVWLGHKIDTRTKLQMSKTRVAMSIREVETKPLRCDFGDKSRVCPN